MTERLLVLGVLFVLIGIPVGITLSKRLYLEFALGLLLFGLIWWIAVFRLARPSSWWARRFYGPEKMQRAFDRFGSASTPGQEV